MFVKISTTMVASVDFENKNGTRTYSVQHYQKWREEQIPWNVTESRVKNIFHAMCFFQPVRLFSNQWRINQVLNKLLSYPNISGYRAGAS